MLIFSNTQCLNDDTFIQVPTVLLEIEKSASHCAVNEKEDLQLEMQSYW